MKRWLLITVSVIFVICVFLSLSILDPCEKRETPKIMSSDNRYSVHTNDLNCHATVSYIGSVVLYDPTSFRLPWNKGKGDSVFGFHGTRDSVKAEWVDNKTLKIIYPGCGEIYEQKSTWKDINILYENTCSQTILQ